MDARPAHLPDYKQPPLNEVALGVQFSDIKGLGSVHVGLFWQAIRERFPKWSEQPPLPSAFEVFGGAEQRVSRPVVEMFTTAPMNRFWFIEQNDVELIQLQRDRFHHNWRKIGRPEQDANYPHYERIRKSFREGLDRLSTFLSDQKLGAIEPNQCEVTYVNHFDVDEDEGFAAATVRLFGHWQTMSPEQGSNLENVTADLKYRIYRPGAESPIGRLHVSIKPAYRNDGLPIIVMQLVGRGRPLGETLDGCLEFMDIAREAIVVKFTQLTSHEMHRQWGRFQ